MTDMLPRNRKGSLLLLAGLLVFVLPIPGTIALRYFLLGALLLALLPSVKSFRQSHFGWSGVMLQIALVALFSAWLVLQALWLSDEKNWALGEIRGQWLPAILIYLAGLGVAAGSDGNPEQSRSTLTLVVFALLLQAFFSMVVSVPYFVEHGVFPQGKALLTAGKLEISYFNNILLAFLAVDGIWRWGRRQPLLRFPDWLVGIGIIFVFFSNLAFGARNGVVGSILLLISLGVLLIFRERRRLGVRRVLIAVLLCTLAIGALSWTNLKMDARWKRFIETVEIAWEIDQYRAWTDPKGLSLPLMQNGEPVEPSAYSRIAWIHAGLRLWADYPLGVGYGRNAFGHALRKTTDTPLGHAHSGWVDLGIGAGIPGLLFFGSIMMSFFILGLKRYFHQNDPLGLVLALLAAGYAGRLVLDSVNRDHMLMLYFFFVGLLSVLSLSPDLPKSTDSDA